MGLLIWLIIGALFGWSANILRKTKLNAHRLECVFAGMTGGVIGGLLTNVFYPPGGIHIHFSWQTAITAALGAVVILFVYFIFDKKIRY